MARLKTAVVGLGYIGNIHLEALFRVGTDVVAVADANKAACEQAQMKYGISHIYIDYRELIENEILDAVHICTPNHMHYEIALAAIDKGLHVLCEKPLALTSKQAKELTEQLGKKELIGAVNFNYRYYPVLQHARRMIGDNAIGAVHVIKASYLQDWLLFDTDYNWRLDPAVGGESRAMADIGSHVCDLAEHITGLKIVAVMADLMTLHEVRKKPLGEVKTFDVTKNSGAFENVPMDTEDYAGLLVRFDSGAKGVFAVSQVSAGQKCRIQLEIYGAEKSISWDHEAANTLSVGERTPETTVFTRDMTMNTPEMDFAHVPAGHPEGYPDVVKNIVTDFYGCIKNSSCSQTLPTFADGYGKSLLVDAVLKSHKEQRWVTIDEVRL